MKIAIPTWTAALFLAGASCVYAATPTSAPAPPPATAPASQPDDAHWGQIITQLSSDDFKTRDAAQKELGKSTWREMSLLKRLAASATDEEAKARLQQRLAELEEECALNPPPISVDLDKATLAQVAKALSQATGSKIDSWPPEPAGGRMQTTTFTVKVQDQPFWEVFRELNRQHSLGLQGYDGLRLMQQEPGRKNFLVEGGVAMIPVSITRSRNADLQQNPGSQLGSQEMTIRFEAFLDPRLVVVKYSQPILLEATDDLGNTLWKDTFKDRNLWDFTARTNLVLNAAVSLNIPQNPGTKIASARVEQRLLLQTAAQTLDVADVEKKLNQPFNIGGRNVTISSFKPNVAQHQVSFNINVAEEVPLRAIRAQGGAAQEPPLITISFVDANGKSFFSTGIVRGGTGGSCGGDFVEPVKLVFSVPTKTRDAILHFEFKDLPLP